MSMCKTEKYCIVVSFLHLHFEVLMGIECVVYFLQVVLKEGCTNNKAGKIIWRNFFSYSVIFMVKSPDNDHIFLGKHFLTV